MQDIKQIADAIYSQISVSTRMACGVRNLICGKSSDDLPYLQMRVGDANKWLYIRIYYMPSDTYNVELCKVKGKPSYDVVQLEEAEDVYCEQLSQIIYHMVNK
jgi:hypothetical protein